MVRATGFEPAASSSQTYREYFFRSFIAVFGGVPAPSVVIYVVKNASRPISGECSPMPDGKRFSLLLAAL